MTEFLELLPPELALAGTLALLSPRLEVEEIETIRSLGRVTAEPITAGYPLPSFTRSTVDGYAVRAADTYGASDLLPAYLQIVGEVPMGADANSRLHPGESALIHTGGMLPNEADAVVMVEHTQIAKTNEVEVLRAVAVGENTLKIGEDVADGEEVIAARSPITPGGNRRIDGAWDHPPKSDPKTESWIDQQRR